MRRTLPRLLHFLRPFAGQVALSVLLGTATVAAGIGLLGTSAYLIATAALQPSVAVLQVAIVGVRFFGISRAAARYLERLVSHSVNFRLLAGLRTWFYRKLEPLAPARLQDFRSADLLSRAVADIETLENFYVRAVAPPLVALVITAGVSLFVGRYDPRLGLILLGALLLAGIGLPLLAYALNRAPGQAVIERRAELHTALLDLVQGMPDLLAYGQGAAQADRVHAAGEQLGQAQRTSIWAGALVNALGLLISGMALWGVLVVGIPLVGSQFDGVALAVLALVTMAAFESVTPLAQAAQHLESSLHAARRLFALADMEPDVYIPANPLPAPRTMDLRIRGLAFAYVDGLPPVFEGFDLDLPPGKHAVVIGASGAGKTTLFNLLLRFWEFREGEILLDGQDIRAYDPQDVRMCIGLVAQNPYLFTGSLRHNLLLACPGTSEQQMVAALQAAQWGELLARLPNGLDTWIGERGLQLSVGERRRLAVAQCLLRNAPLLLLDEPTEGLDAENEQRMLAALRAASVGRSVLMITHRRVALQDFDQVIFLG